MTKKVFYLIDEEVVPDVYKKVIEVKKLLGSGEIDQVTEAVKKVGISRGTFYKYKDYIFLSGKENLGNIATLSFFLRHDKGVLSGLLNKVADLGGNIITINQDIPITEVASLTLTIDTKDLSISVDNLVEEIKKLRGVCTANILAIT